MHQQVSSSVFDSGQQRRLTASCCVLLVVAAACASPGEAFAKPQYKAAVTSYYGDLIPQQLRACHLCHLTDDEISKAPAEALGDEEQPWNALGRSLAKLGREQIAAGAVRPDPIVYRLRALADADADGDGVGNELEIIAGAAPGQGPHSVTAEQLMSATQRMETFRRSQSLYAWRPTARVVRPEVPTTGNATWIANPIDAFVSAEQNRQRLAPRPPASKEILLRRVHLDIVGLPPTRQELAAFQADAAPDAYSKVVERLLASPQYGERWGRHWMDVWRYSDWAGWGEQVRDSHPHVWRWRDWIIESLNGDKPYDEMVREMLAADELKPGDADALRATGFLVRNYKLLSREQWMMETVDHTSRALLGVTFKCAQCHDHLYDPLLQEEYFQFRAIFESYQVRIDRVPGELDVKKAGLSRVYDADPSARTLFHLRGDERTPDVDRKIVPGAPAYLGGGPLNAEPVTLAPLDYYPTLRPAVLADLRQQAEAKASEQQAALNQTLQKHADAETDLAKLAVALAQAKLLAAQADRASLEARITAEQGKHGVTEKAVDAEAIKQLARSASQAERQGKLAIVEVAVYEAQINVATAEQNARDGKGPEEKLVKAVNEAKNKLSEALKDRDTKSAAAKQEGEAYAPLGEVYAKTSSGRRLALARWITSRDNPLAARVAVNHLWTRHFGKGLVETVDEFGQNGRRPAHPALLDWLAAELMEPTRTTSSSPAKPWSMKHLHRLIVNSSTYRQSSTFDSASAAIDPENRYLWQFAPRRLEAEAVRDAVLHLAGSLDTTPGGPELDHQQALQIPRRSIYFRHAPEKQTPFLQIFDMAAPTECYRRRDSIIPQQALALANSELTVKQSRRLARTLAHDAGESNRTFISAAFLQLLSREPVAEEVAECEAFLTEQTTRLSQQPDGATTKDPTNLDTPAAEAGLHARENLVHVLFNHHEFVMIK